MLLALLLACAPDPSELADAGQLPPPVLTLEVPEVWFPGYDADLSVTGDLAVGEVVYVVVSMSAGTGPCFPQLGGRCLGLRSPRLLAEAVVEETGAVTLTVPTPAAVPPGVRLYFQAVAVRGWGGSATVMSAVDSGVTEVPAPGCTDDAADNYDANANLDDGSCTYSDPVDWTPMNFTSNDWKNGCTGGAKYVKLSGFADPAYVGVQLCSATRYKIFLGNDLSGTFYSIGDGCGSGQDHCTLIGGTHQDFYVDYSTNSGQPGYTRCESETPVFGTLSGAHWTPSWSECGVSFP